MPRIRPVIGAAIFAACFAIAAQAQTSAPKPGTAEPTMTTKVQNWTSKQWNAAKREWAKDKAKWDACNRQAKERHLSGRKSWSFIYDCMKA